MKKAFASFLVLSLLCSPLMAAPKSDKAHGQQTSDESNADKIGNETMDALTEALTGKEKKSVESSKSMPPGLAKKGKTPPGWDKGKKTGWKKDEKSEEGDSLIKKWIKGLFAKKSQQETQQ